jgi:hypothetical protein
MTSPGKGDWVWNEEQRNYYRYKLDRNGDYMRDSSGMVLSVLQHEKRDL